MKGTRQALTHMDDILIIDDYIRTGKGNAGVLLNAYTDICLAENIIKAKFLEVESTYHGS